MCEIPAVLLSDEEGEEIWGQLSEQDSSAIQTIMTKAGKKKRMR